MVYQVLPDGEGLVVGMHATEHALVAHSVSHTEPDLVCNCLERELVICICKSAGKSLVGTFFSLNPGKKINGLLKPAIKHVVVCLKGNESISTYIVMHGDMKPVDAIEEK